MLQFTQWLALKPLDEDIADAKRHLGRALVTQNSRESSGMDILPHINSFKDSISRCTNKAGQGSDETLARDLASIFNSLDREADEAVSEPDPSLRRYMLSGLLRRMDSELSRPTSVFKADDNPLGDRYDGHYHRPDRVFSRPHRTADR